MENIESVLEAEIDLDQEALRKARSNDKHGERAAKLANGGIKIPDDTREFDAGIGSSGETSPLLNQSNGGREQESWSGGEDFAHLKWYRRPSIIWILTPFLLMALAFGGSITPKINLILQLVCKQYYDERTSLDPNFTMAPVDFAGGDNDQCRIPEVQSKVSLFTLYMSLIAGLLSAITSPRLGALSDRYGRKPIMIITSFGTIAGEIITIIAATHPETIRVEWLLVGGALDGLTGSFIVAMAIVNSYATDCTPATHRNVAFGYIHGCLFTGVAIGPIIAGYLVKYTGKIVIVFYILLAVHVFFISFIAFAVPESLSKKRQQAAREKHDQLAAETEVSSDWINRLRSFNLLAPLKVLWPTGEGSSPQLRRNLVLLAAVDTIMFGVAMGSMTVVIIYTNYMFGWKTFESARFISIVNICRVFCLLVLMPVLTRLVRGKPGGPRASKASGSDNFDISIIRVAVLFDTVGYLGYTLARSGNMMILSGAVAAVGGIGSPVLQSALTKHVPPEQTGQLLGATGLLHALARVVAPTVFNAIYAATVGKFTQTVFVCLCSTFGFGLLVSLFVRPHGKLPPGHSSACPCADTFYAVYPHDPNASSADASTTEALETDESAESYEASRIPVVSAMADAFAHVTDRLGLTGRSVRL
jgi:MFS family permease